MGSKRNNNTTGDSKVRAAAANAQAAEFVRDAFEKAQNDHRVHARRAEEYLHENGELLTEVANHWEKQVGQIGRAHV